MEARDVEEGESERQPLLTKPKNGIVHAPCKVKQPRVGFFERRRRRQGIEQYYSEQTKLQELYRQDDAILHGFDAAKHTMECDKKGARRRKIDRLLASTIFVFNIVMLTGNLIAAILSGSLSVISAFVDSSMDIVSSVAINWAVWSINNTNFFNYPRGRERLELVAVIICSMLMGSANIMLIVQSVQSIISHSAGPDANIPTLAILLGGISVKLVLMILCYRHGTSNSKTLALDQRNDILTSAVALAGAYVGDHYWPYADPAGAILVCTYVALSWFRNAFEHIPLIVGRRVAQEHLSRVLRIAIQHDEKIKCIDHILVYHVGEKALVEIHVVLDEHLPLRITHDITEALDHKIRALDFVERVFLHVDYYCDGKHDTF
ncbi:cation efflux family protein [Aphelenchoides avenae]|nr:cation efflux family protein [Aphelenchus avenae]